MSSKIMASHSRKVIITSALTTEIISLTNNTPTMLSTLYKPVKEPSTSKILSACTLSSLRSSRSLNVKLSLDITTLITLPLVTSLINSHLTAVTSAKRCTLITKLRAYPSMTDMAKESWSMTHITRSSSMALTTS